MITVFHPFSLTQSPTRSQVAPHWPLHSITLTPHQDYHYPFTVITFGWPPLLAIPCQYVPLSPILDPSQGPQVFV